ncbi:MAG TPA: hypothetical protein VG848_14255, partial [Acetobacteraceae bacterium]|nr:hypothetical protein [Acetobacteraceae bacterium]
MRAISSCSEKVLWTFPQAQSGKRRKEEERTLFFLERKNQRTFVLSLIAHGRHLAQKTRQSLSASFCSEEKPPSAFRACRRGGFFELLSPDSERSAIIWADSATFARKPLVTLPQRTSIGSKESSRSLPASVATRCS